MTSKITDENAFWRTPPGVQRGYTQARFGQIHYRFARPAEATQTPLMCFHLSPSSGRIYARFLAEMGKNRLAIAPDTPGFGDSDVPAEPPEIADYAAAMGEVLDALEIETVDLMGYHTGSKIALELAQQRPAQVRRVVLVSAPIYSDEELESQKSHYAGREADDAGDFLKAAWDGQKRWRAKDAPDIFVHREVVEALRGVDHSWWGHRAAFRYPHADALPKVRQPVTILCPKDDLYEQTLRAADYIDNGRLLELPDWGGHGMLDMHTGEVAQIVRTVLDGPEEAHQPAAAKLAPDPRPGADTGFRKRFIDGPYGQIHLRYSGPGAPAAAPLFCFHSSPNSGLKYSAILRMLGQERTVVAVDTPGFGESEAPAKPPEIEDYATTMAYVIETLGAGPVDIMGYHTGSETCIELARQRPDLVRKIVMNSAPIFSDEELQGFRDLYAPDPIAADGSHLVRFWQRMIPFYGPTVPHPIRQRNFAEGLRGGPMSHWGHRAAFNYPLAKKMAEVENEILVINLDDDLREQTKQAEGILRNGRIHTIEKYGHGWFDIIPDEAARILREFLDA
ncbi:MAG TPA: alpha/beta hydrolase [Alphaproteobacteria bacterium]|jgi:pimeloyl-ACP methyl ester carboxylesterase|nr:alpha/beta hydrolase [Alphaproteobacteria bacterium]